MTLVAAHWPSCCVPQPDRGGQVLDADHHADEAVLAWPGRAPGAVPAPSGARRRGPRSARGGASLMSQKCSRCPYLRPSSNSGTIPFSIMDGVRPLGRDDHVVVDVPPDVVGQVLVAAVLLELAEHVEGGVVEQRDPAGALGAVAAAQAGHVQVAGAAVHRVRARVVGPLAQFLRAEHLHDLGRRRVLQRVEDVDARGPDAGDDQVAPVAVGVRAGRAERARAGVPAEVVQFVAEVRQFGVADHGAVRGGAGVGVHHRDPVGLVAGRENVGHVGELLRRARRRVGGGAVEGGVVVVVLICHRGNPFTSSPSRKLRARLSTLSTIPRQANVYFRPDNQEIALRRPVPGQGAPGSGASGVRRACRAST